ncbi:MAG: hypothetical protein JWQ09_5404 [Segetibacter sp.]|nr:hypothetical protein [Segetibacter sp.]
MLIITTVNLPGLLKAQPPIDNDDVADNPVPFDGGISLLVAAAIGYGLKKANNKKKADTL